MFNTERPTKRARIPGLWDSNVGDATSEIDISAARQANDMRLKSRFEDIFEKYGKDFSSVGDEIDLATGNIVIDNGHIERMTNEQDLGAQPWKYDFDPLGEPEFVTENVAETPDAPIGKWMNQNGKPTDLERPFSRNHMSFDFAPGSYSDHIELSGGSQTDFDQGHPKPSSRSVDPCWQTPEIDERLFGSSPVPAAPPTFPRNRTASPPNSGSLWALPQTRRKKSQRTNGGKPHRALKVRLPSRPGSSGRVSDSDSDDPLQNTLPSLSTPPKINITDEAKNVIDTPSPIAEEPMAPVEPSPPLSEHVLSAEEKNDQQPEKGTPETSTPTPAKRNRKVSVESPLLQENGAIENEILAAPDGGIPLEESQSMTHRAISQQETKLSAAINPFTPSEIQIILTQRVVQKLPWKEVSRSVPNRTSGQLRQWYYVQSTDIKNCPQSLIPLTAKEKDQLEAFKSKSDVTWEDLEAVLENQTRNEIKCKWAEMCLGEMWEDWKNSHYLHAQRQDGDFMTPPKLPKRRLTAKSPSPTKLSETVQITTPSRTPRKPSVFPTEPPKLVDESSDSDDPFSQAFASAWPGSGLSAIQIDTPPKPRNPQKRQSFPMVKNSPWVDRSGST
ncbi:hypothetical protein BDBG_04208 [Blastomyces gilchristii SLH14081]|uniref:Myb-like DNA-binding domain-containing protein n=1 Tax=Blastomyces gilchristii (strain SLH14081) TaxID=559298 RepID=A0A179UJI3_BLAGS|nr:uncharacterized protein BDBG_04208 [Blastomyces gilchristii SLH14081]EQL28815.1 hypothetical protein BDFG_08476 [Blastomyces dermatitidis ATCC 26199]OAT08236.1 hypothetical protein BDBG_04208 [Blastomyces gilchristii SLH14081]